MDMLAYHIELGSFKFCRSQSTSHSRVASKGYTIGVQGLISKLVSQNHKTNIICRCSEKVLSNQIVYSKTYFYGSRKVSLNLS
jgi:hypothetical protein